MGVSSSTNTATFLLSAVLIFSCSTSSASSSSLTSVGERVEGTPADVIIPSFAVEPTNVRVGDQGSSTVRSAVFTCLLAQLAPERNGRPLTSAAATLSWFYNGRQIDSVTDKIRIPLANGSLYVSAAAAEHPTPNSPVADLPLPTARGYNCRATSLVDFNGKTYNATVVSRMAHVIKSTTAPAFPSVAASGMLRPQRLPVRVGDVVVLVCGGGSSTSSPNGNSTFAIGAGPVIISNNSNLTVESYVWFRDDMTFPDEGVSGNSNSKHSSVTIFDNGRILEFAPISADDFGEYACTKATLSAEQRRSSVVSRYIISQLAGGSIAQISEPALRFLLKPSDRITISKSSGSSVLLLCSAADAARLSGFLPTITWLKDGATILNTDDTRADGYFATITKTSSKNRYRKIGQGSLLISALETNDTGIYTCRASTTVGATTIFVDANANVSVVAVPKQCYHTSSSSVSAPAGGVIEIDCGVENAAYFFWFHNGNYLPPTTTSDAEQYIALLGISSYLTDAENQTGSASDREYFYEYGLTNNCGRRLNLWALTDGDSGIYQCFGINSAGLASHTTFVAVEQPTFMSLLSNETATSVSNFDFAAPVATRLRNDNSDDKVKQPQNVRITSKTPTSVHLTWDPPSLSQDAAISGYVVLLRSATQQKTDVTMDMASRIRRLFAATHDLLVDRLAPGRKYEVTVAAAFKLNGQTTLTVGAMSHPIIITPEAPSPSDFIGNNGQPSQGSSSAMLIQQPRNLRVELRNPTTVSLVWIAPASPPTPDSGKLRSAASTRSLPTVNRYRLFYRSGIAGVRNSQQEAFIDLPGHQTSHVLTSLQPNTPYTFYVRAGMAAESDAAQSASMILGPPSKDVTIWTPSSAPTGSPQKVEAIAVSPSRLSVRWQPPPPNMQNGLITGYKVTYQLRSRSAAASSAAGEFKGRVALTDGITTMVELSDGVAPNTEYEIRIAAININGTGPLSESVFAKTPEQQLTESATPGAPFAFTARAPSPSQIILSWQPPSSSGSVLVRGYFVSFGVGEPYRNQVMVDASKTEHVLTNLRPSSEYIISLRSYNNYGYGPEVFQAVRTPHLTSSDTALGGLISAGSSEMTDDGTAFDMMNLPHQSRQPSAHSEALAVPLGVKAFTLSDSAMLVSWTDPNEHSYRTNGHHQRGKEHLVTYTVRYGPLISQVAVDNHDSNSRLNVPTVVSSPMRWRLVNSTLPSVRVHSLEPYQEYEFAVRIVRVDADYPSRQQISDWSMSATNRTLDAPPSDAPRDVKAVEVASSSLSVNRGSAVRVTWQPPLKPNGVITSYVVFYSAHSPNRAERDWQVIGVGGDRFSVLIRRLQPDTAYYFKIQAKNNRGYGPTSTPPVHIRTSALPVKPVVKAVTENEAIGVHRLSTNKLAGQSIQTDNGPNELSDEAAVEDSWPFEPSFFENHVMSNGGPAMASTNSPQWSSSMTTVKLALISQENSRDNLQDSDANVITNAGASTLWMVVGAAVLALLVCAVASIAAFFCRKMSSPRSGTSKLMSKSESGRLTSSNGSGKSVVHENCGNSGLPTTANGDMWTMRDHMELRQQLISSAELQSTIGGAVSAGMSVLTMSEDNLMQERGPTCSSRQRPSQLQDQQASMRSQLYHIDHYDNETGAMGDTNDHARQTTSSIACSPNGPMSYRHQQAGSVVGAGNRLFNSRTSTATLSCHQGESYPLLGSGHHTGGYRHANPNSSQNNTSNDDDFDANSRLAGPYHQVQHRSATASTCGMVVDHHHLLTQQFQSNSRQQQQQQPHVINQTLPRLSIATMPSPGPASMHRYEPLLTTTSNDSRTTNSGVNQGSYNMFCPPSAQTPDSGFDDHNLHQMQQQQRQRASLSSSSYGGGSVSSSTTNNIAQFAICSSSTCGNRQQHHHVLTTAANVGGNAETSPAGSSSLSTPVERSERPRLSSFQPLQSSTTSTTPPALANSSIKNSFLHLSRVLPPTPGQVRSGAIASAACSTATLTIDRTSSATLTASPVTNNSQHANNAVSVGMLGMPFSNGDSANGIIGIIHLPPAPPELHCETVVTNDDDLAAAAELSCLDGLIKDLKLNVASSSSTTLASKNSLAAISSSTISASNNFKPGSISLTTTSTTQ